MATPAPLGGWAGSLIVPTDAHSPFSSSQQPSGKVGHDYEQPEDGSDYCCSLALRDADDGEACVHNSSEDFAHESTEEYESTAARLEEELADLRPRVRALSEALDGRSGRSGVRSAGNSAAMGGLPSCSPRGASIFDMPDSENCGGMTSTSGTEWSHSEIMADLLLRPMPALMSVAPTLAAAVSLPPALPDVHVVQAPVLGRRNKLSPSSSMPSRAPASASSSSQGVGMAGLGYGTSSPSSPSQSMGAFSARSAPSSLGSPTPSARDSRSQRSRFRLVTEHGGHCGAGSLAGRPGDSQHCAQLPTLEVPALNSPTGTRSVAAASSSLSPAEWAADVDCVSSGIRLPAADMKHETFGIRLSAAVDEAVSMGLESPTPDVESVPIVAGSSRADNESEPMGVDSPVADVEPVSICIRMAAADSQSLAMGIESSAADVGHTSMGIKMSAADVDSVSMGIGPPAAEVGAKSVGIRAPGVSGVGVGERQRCPFGPAPDESTALASLAAAVDATPASSSRSPPPGARETETLPVEHSPSSSARGSLEPRRPLAGPTITDVPDIAASARRKTSASSSRLPSPGTQEIGAGAVATEKEHESGRSTQLDGLRQTVACLRREQAEKDQHHQSLVIKLEAQVSEASGSGRACYERDAEHAEAIQSLDLRIRALHDECRSERDACEIAQQSELHMEQHLQLLEVECTELSSRLEDRKSRENSLVEPEITQLSAETTRAEQTAHYLRGRVDSLEAACEDGKESLLDAQRAYQRSVWHSEEVEKRLQRAQTVGHRLSTELDDAREDAASLALARRQLHAQLESEEAGRYDMERQLAAAQLQVDDLQMRCDTSVKNHQWVQSRSDALQSELRRARLQLEETAGVAEQRNRLGQELQQAQHELTDMRHMQHQEKMWALSLRQENEQLETDLRAAGALSETLSAELRGTGEKAQGSHAKCCELWVALEKQRLETQRLRAALDAARRENSVLSHQLTQLEDDSGAVGVGDQRGLTRDEEVLQYGMFRASDASRNDAATRRCAGASRSDSGGSEPTGLPTSWSEAPVAVQIAAPLPQAPRPGQPPSAERLRALGPNPHAGVADNFRGATAIPVDIRPPPKQCFGPTSEGGVIHPNDKGVPQLCSFHGSPPAPGGQQTFGNAAGSPCACGADAEPVRRFRTCEEQPGWRAQLRELRSREAAVASPAHRHTFPSGGVGVLHAGGNAPNVPAARVVSVDDLPAAGARPRNRGFSPDDRHMGVGAPPPRMLRGGLARDRSFSPAEDAPFARSQSPEGRKEKSGGAGGPWADGPLGVAEVRKVPQGPFPQEIDVQRNRQPQEGEAQRNRQSLDNEAQKNRYVESLERQLTVLNGERQYLESTLMKFPSNSAGRTIAERRQKREAEERLANVDRSITDLRQTLRQLNPK